MNREDVEFLLQIVTAVATVVAAGKSVYEFSAAASSPARLVVLGTTAAASLAVTVVLAWRTRKRIGQVCKLAYGFVRHNVLFVASLAAVYMLLYALQGRIQDQLAISTTAALVGASVCLILGTARLYLRWQDEPSHLFYGGGLPMCSGTVGEFAHNPEGPWTPSVHCSPVYPDWPHMEGARWVWIRGRPNDPEARSGQTVWHRLRLGLPRFSIDTVNIALTLMVDDFVDVSINGHLVRRFGISEGVVEQDLALYLRPGENVIMMELENSEGSPDSTGLTNPTAVVYRLDRQ